MHAGFVILIWALNFAISAWNAYAVGLAWVETKHCGGWPRLMAWSGAVMSACGFSWCYLIILAAAAHGLEWLSNDDIALAMRIGYILLLPGFLISGLMITLDSWARAYRTRRIADIGIAAWNTYAQIHNVYHAIKNMDGAFGNVVDAIRSRRSKGNNDGASLIVVFAVVVVALLSGVLTTAVIISRVAGRTQLPDESERSRPDAEMVKR
jgi:hypothetical protein